jgi:SNF2 family DNA or RNA helicase
MLFMHQGQPRALLRAVDDFGFLSYDLVGLPRRLCENEAGAVVDMSIDRRRVKLIDSPAKQALSKCLNEQETWLSVSNRTLARIYSAFLIAEDPQRRIEARKAATLMHQVSLVQHILERTELRRVLIGDEVGLGKTIEAGLLIRQLIERNPSLRVLYLAPARLVRNVVREFREKLDIDARQWVAGSASDARINEDRVVIASIHRAVFGDNFNQVVKSGPWDVIVADECHHLSDWDPAGGKPNQSFKLVSQLNRSLSNDGRLVLLSGTPHQGSESRFKNILRLLSDDGKDFNGASGRVIFRTKDRVRDWNGAPLFPAREIRNPIVVELGLSYEQWYQRVGALYESVDGNGVALRAAGWAKGQALQWAASSVHAGVAFLVRLGIRRLNWSLENEAICDALSALRPYRGGSLTEPLQVLYERIHRQIGSRALKQMGEDDEEEWDEDVWRPDPILLAELIREGVGLMKSDAASAKWAAVCELIDQSDGEKIVLFAQPVETVTLVADVLAKRYKQKPALIIGNQSDEERIAEVVAFQSVNGPRFLVSSRAGGEGLNMQKARRLIHLDVPWNPMELEQRIGRVHRFGSRKTVIVDTVVAAGSREIDMYRIAREKLLLITRHLDPEQFETLFSRVMSLVPPQELESVLVEVGDSSLIDDRSAAEIGRLVTAGFKSWNAFDEAYRREADEIRSANPGQANWADLGAFLVRFAGARDGAGATFSSFTFADQEIVAVDDHVPTVTFEGQCFACGDTGGLPATTDDGKPARQMGLNVDEVQLALRCAFAPDRQVGLAFLNSRGKLDLFDDISGPVSIMVFLRQKLHQEAGLWSETAVTLHLFSVAQVGQPESVDSRDAATIIRSMMRMPRIKYPTDIPVRSDLENLETAVVDVLRRPSELEMSQGIRYAVWPIANVHLVR